jgi:hypothetical protein
MKRSLALLLPLALAAACSGDAAPRWRPARPVGPRRGRARRYIVVLKDDANPRSVAALLGINPRRVYTAALQGFAATLDAGGSSTPFATTRRCAYVEPDAPVQALHHPDLPGVGAGPHRPAQPPAVAAPSATPRTARA